MTDEINRRPPEEPPRNGASDAGDDRVAESVAPSFAENVRMLWRLRGHYGPYLLPALGLLLLALVQADLALAATTAGQRLIDVFAARAADGAVAAGPAAAGAAGLATTVSERILDFLARGGGPLRLALLMALFLIASQAMGIIIEQMRTLLHESFRYRIQAKLLAAFSTELAARRGQRSSANNAEIFTTDASQLSGVLIFETVAVLEHLTKVMMYTYGLARIDNGLRIVAVALPATLLFQTAVARFFVRREAREIERSETLNMRMRALATEFFDVLGRLVYFRGERAYVDRLLELSRKSAHANRRFQLVSSIHGAVMGIVTTLSLPLVVAILSLSVVAAVGAPDLSAGTLVQAQALLMLLTASTSALVGIPSTLAQASPSARRVEEVLQIPPPGDEPSELSRLRAGAAPPALRVADLVFTYPGAAAPILRGVSFDIPAGACFGVIGGSASGKSTLARLLLGDRVPTSGQIYFDDVDITQWHLWWRRELIGMLPAEQGFVRGTLEENVLFGRARSDVRAFDEALRLSGVAAMAKARASDGGMRMQIDSDVQEHLSSGERRRVGIARLLVGQQRFWIFDEPGAGLDAHTMNHVAGALAPGSALLQGRTTMIITHDPDVFATDFNLYLEKGVVAARGTHQELLATNAAYAALVDRNARERAVHRARPVSA